MRKISGMAAALVALSSLASAFAANEFMLCFHSDGSVVVEDFEPSCCRDAGPSDEADCDCCPKAPAAETRRCPDRDCKDLPFFIQSVSHAPRVDAFSIDIQPAAILAVVIVAPVDSVDVRPRIFLPDAGPPLVGPGDHLPSAVRLL